MACGSVVGTDHYYGRQSTAALYAFLRSVAAKQPRLSNGKLREADGIGLALGETAAGLAASLRGRLQRITIVLVACHCDLELLDCCAC